MNFDRSLHDKPPVDYDSEPTCPLTRPVAVEMTLASDDEIAVEREYVRQRNALPLTLSPEEYAQACIAIADGLGR